MLDGSFARRLFLKILGAASATTVVSSCAGPTEGGGEGNAVADGQSFEYIVVGSGAGGGPLASNLARAGHSVLLLEAGTDQGNRLDYQIPAFHTLSTETPSMRWDYFVRHYADDAQQRRDSKLTPQGVWYPRSGTLGGCTAHNAMITVYPHERDWDHIAEVTGDPSWRGAAMRQYFQRVEQCRYIDSGDTERAAGHGFAGYLRTSMPDARLALADKKLLTIIASAAIAFDINGLASALRGLFSGASLSGIRSQLLGLMSSDLNNAAPNRDQTEGLFTIPLATDGMRRSGPREWILGTIAAGHPLTLWTNKLVTRVLFEDGTTANGRHRARGVEFIDAGHQYRADPAAGRTPDGPRRRAIATREVILCAGAFNTPQLLMLSGIGPDEELARHHIDVRVSAPGVGRNLQDRYEVGVVSEMASDLTALNGCTFGRSPRAAAASRDICWTRQEQPEVPAASSPDPCVVTWNNTHGGVYASNGGVVGIVKRSTPDQPVPDLFIFGLPSYFKGYEPCYSGRATADHRHFTWAVLKAHTDNTVGTVRLRSVDPRDTPDIDFHFFADGIAPDGTPRAPDLNWVSDGAAQLSAANRDLNAVVQGVKLARQIGRTTRDLMLFGQFKEVFPGPRVESDEEIATFVRNEAWGHHASCTCPMGRVAQNDGDPDDPMAVVDSNFRVRGTCNLRVVDASVFPKIPGFFIVAPIYMIAEKATDAILADTDTNCERA